MKPVYIGGQGLVCNAGLNPSAAADALRDGHPSFQRRALSVGERAYAAIADIQGPWLDRLRAALTQTLETALTQAGLDLNTAAELPLFIGSSSLHVGLGECQGQKGQIPRIAHLSCYIRHWFGWRAPIGFSTTACTSSLVALSQAANAVRAGKAPAAIVLGIELENRTSLNGFTAMGLLSPSVARPFCAQRDGLLLGEAVAATVVRAQPARWRLAAIELGLDPHSPTGVDPNGGPQRELLQRALSKARWTAEQVDLIKAHAAGSPSTDLAESIAINSMFTEIPTLLSLKSAIGHTLGASGTAELALLTGCLERGFIPPTPGFAEVDPELNLTPTTRALSEKPQRMLLNWIGFGGSLAALALEDTTLC